MAFLRHVGKHGDRKVAVVFREVPNEPHMAIVVYTETLNRNVHDPLIKCIESDIGQSSDDLATALNRTYTTDGQIILQKLHAEGMLKKVQAEQVVMTPSPNNRIKLSELNTLLDEMKQGEEAVKKLADIDSQLGLQDPTAVQRRREAEAVAARQASVPPVAAAADGLLGDDALANNLRQQAARMESEAKGLLAEAQRLIEQANEMNPLSTPNVATAEKKTRGRPRKSQATA